MSLGSELTQNEYGTIDIGAVQLESGREISHVEVAYERVGSSHLPVVFVCHALTGNQVSVGTKDSPGWWSSLIGKGKHIDTDKWQIITMNVLGGCHGTTGPLSTDRLTDKLFQADFPFVTVRDIVNVHYKALRKLGIDHLRAIIGGSLGGMQALEFGIIYPTYVDLVIPIAATPYFSDYALAFNAIGRKAILQDPKWVNGFYDKKEPPVDGLGTARMIGMVTYRSPGLFNKRHDRKSHDTLGNDHTEKAFEIESYLHYQGEKLSKRFDANSYLYLLKAMDSHDIGRGRGGWKNALETLKPTMHAIGFQGDLLYPPKQIKEMVDVCHLYSETGNFIKVDTDYGHDGFLVEIDKWGRRIKGWLNGD